ncbi:hypothetical protein KAF25_000370, partial [Fusarium avenaceum]
TWKRTELSQRGFFYEEDLRNMETQPLPPHVETLRQSMLDFACQDQDPPSGECLQTQHLASIYSDGGYPEDRWEDFFRDTFFTPLVKDISTSQGISRRVSRCNYYYDAIAFSTDALWTTFGVERERHRIRAIPKPDFVFYLPMYHLTAESPIPRITDYRGRKWNEEPTSPLVQTFSWSNFKELYGHGLRPSPFNIFEKKEPLEADLKSYPWLIVEYKNGKKAIRESERLGQLETACCQALNASACAVKLNQIAARYAVERPEGTHIPPIPAVTTIGTEAKVWITYSAKNFMASSDTGCYRRRRQGYMMQCIWKGDMTNIRDIREFRLILENTYTWAMRVFKHQISVFVDQWSVVHCSVEPDFTNAAMARRDESTDLSRGSVSMIQSWLDRQPSVELDDRSNTALTPKMMGILVEKICSAERKKLTKDMERLFTEKIRELDLGKRESTFAGPSRRRSEKLQSHLDSEQAQQTSHATAVNDDDFEDNSPADPEHLSPGSTLSTPSTGLRRSLRLIEKAASQPSTPSGSRTTQAPSASVSTGKKAVRGKIPKAPKTAVSPATPRTPKTPKTSKVPKTLKTPEARARRALEPVLVIEISSGSESSDDPDGSDAEDIPAYSPSSTHSTFFTASEGRSVVGSMGSPSVRGSMGPPSLTRSSMGPPPLRAIMKTLASNSPRGPPSVASSVDPLVDTRNIDDWGHPVQRNPRIPARSIGATRLNIKIGFIYDRSFIVYQTANIIESLGFFLPTIYLPTYAQSVLHASPFLAAVTVMIVNAFSAFGIFIMGLMTDK